MWTCLRQLHIRQSLIRKQLQSFSYEDEKLVQYELTCSGDWSFVSSMLNWEAMPERWSESYGTLASGEPVSTAHLVGSPDGDAFSPALKFP